MSRDSRSPLRAKTPLRRMTPLKGMRRTALAQQSKRAKQEAAIWKATKQKREGLLRDKYGYLPCEWCKQAITGGYHGHHNNHNRRDNDRVANCRLLHFSCHMIVEDKNVRDVPSLLDDEEAR